METYNILSELHILESGQAASLDAEASNRLRTKIALCVGNREALERLLGNTNDIFDDFYPDMKMPTPDTDDTITGFLNRFGHDDEKETDLLTRMIFTPPVASPEVWTLPDDESDAEASVQVATDSTAAGIESFLAAHAITDPQATVTKKSEVNHTPFPPTRKATSLTESLARVMIRNKNYSKALEIITQLSLSEPEKSIYFADQIRFLKKLIKNQEKLNNN